MRSHFEVVQYITIMSKQKIVRSQLPKSGALSDAPSCEVHLVHLDAVRQVQAELLPIEKAQRMAEFFSILADPTRLRLLSALAQQELCVCDLAVNLPYPINCVSCDRSGYSSIERKVAMCITA